MNKIKTLVKHYPIIFLSLVLIAFFFLLFLFNRFLFAPKILLLCVIVLAAVFTKKLKTLLNDWFVFLSFLYLFDSLRGTIYILTCKLGLPVYTLYVIKIEKFLFGELPSVTLQQAFLKEDSYTLLEKFLTIVHGTHFIAFLYIGLIIWLYMSKHFQTYKISFYLVTILGVSGYFIIPTAPPWMASEIFKVVPDIIHFNTEIYNMSIPDISAGFTTNPIAAMPSLHAAFPILSSLILWRIYRWKASAFFLYCFLVLFAIVYTGDHYVIDIIAGAILALFCFWLTIKIQKIKLKLISRKAYTLKRKKGNILKKNKSLVMGIIILTTGIILGLSNKNQFSNHYELYTYHNVPKYIDFFIHKDQFIQNHAVQQYLGCYYFVRKQYEKALYHFEQALNSAKDSKEKKQTLMYYRQCKRVLFDHKG